METAELQIKDTISSRFILCLTQKNKYDGT